MALDRKLYGRDESDPQADVLTEPQRDAGLTVLEPLMKDIRPDGNCSDDEEGSPHNT